MTARIIENMPAATYHADPCELPSLSTGVAKVLLAKSPRAAWAIHPKLNPDYAHDDDPKFDLGTTAHAMLLENDESRLVIVNADDWRTKVAKALRDAAHAEGKTALLEKDADEARAMVKVAREFIANSEIAQPWADAKSEVTILWHEDGVHLRTRHDRLANARDVIMDYKSTGDASPETFIQRIASLGYHIQDALYRRAVRALGYPDPKFVFVAQETEAPYDCALYGCDPEMQAIGDAAVERAIAIWRQCLSTNRWPGYGKQVMWATPPGWLRFQAEETL